MKKTFAFAAAASIAVAAGSTAQAETVLKMSSWMPAGHPIVTQMMQPWADDVEKATNGRVKVQILPKAVGSPPQHFDIAKDGLADVSYSFHGYTPGRFILTKAVELPFTGDSAEAISTAYWRLQEKEAAFGKEHRGVKLLGLMQHGPGQAFSASKEIKSVKDFEGMKFRVGGGVQGAVAKKLGIVGILKPAPKSYELLSNGVVDGVLFPKETIKGLKLTRLVKHATFVPGGFYGGSFFLAMNPAKFKSLSQEDQAAILKVSGEHWAHVAGKAWDTASAAGVKDMEAAGVDIKEASPQLMAELKTALAPIEAEWVKEAAKRGVDGHAILKQLRDEIAKAKAEIN